MAAIRVNKIASVVYRLGLGLDIDVTENMEARSGNVVVARIRSDKRVYNELELVGGRMAKIARGDVIVGALGRRRALQGFVGDVPETIQKGDEIHLLNMGGVVGVARSALRELGDPARLEVLGMAVKGQQILNVADGALESVDSLKDTTLPPIVLFSGTCMNSGKTYACSQVIKEMSKRGLVVNGAKLTGIACCRDSISMEDHGALRTASFLDAGYASTAGLDPDSMVLMARSVLNEVSRGNPDVIFLELGDGIIGDYGVLDVLEDAQIRSAMKVHVFCAGDMVGAWGGQNYLAERSIDVHIFSGPVTDTEVGVEYLQDTLKKPAINARLEPQRLAEEVVKNLDFLSLTK